MRKLTIDEMNRNIAIMEEKFKNSSSAYENEHGPHIALIFWVIFFFIILSL